jgi:predicted DNA-binding transcriptional regulator AlpA
MAMRLLTGKQLVALKLPRTLRAIYGDVAVGRFPRPVKIGRSTYWRESDVDLFIQVGCDMAAFEKARRGIVEVTA